MPRTHRSLIGVIADILVIYIYIDIDDGHRWHATITFRGTCQEPRLLHHTLDTKNLICKFVKKDSSNAIA